MGMEIIFAEDQYPRRTNDYAARLKADSIFFEKIFSVHECTSLRTVVDTSLPDRIFSILQTYELDVLKIFFPVR
jgi:hypothetical protein